MEMRKVRPIDIEFPDGEIVRIDAKDPEQILTESCADSTCKFCREIAEGAVKLANRGFNVTIKVRPDFHLKMEVM